MSKLFQKINDLNDLVMQGEVMKAFETYYHNDVIMQENDLNPTQGKDANRKREEEFLNNIIEFRAAKPLKVTVGESISMVEWHYDYTHKEWGDRNYTQISVQEWKNGQIISEKFYYCS
ncbi:SnoaL-like domain-containing protein [Ekhidna sp.]|uniref:SnoaL-like domain-containing protein n=1 Tax=Ekhidna sp. TaxID=2608089 RepID=UPI0032998802